MAELGYVQESISDLSKLKGGMEKNPDDWKTAGETPADVQKSIDTLEAGDKNVRDLNIELGQSRVKLKATVKAENAFAQALILKVKGKYANNKSKWAEFGVEGGEDTDTTSTKDIPSKGVIRSIKDDYDGVGFIVEGEPLDDILTYEWQRGEGKAEDTNTIPVFSHLRTVRKAKIVDDDVKSGVRYFYRYCGINSLGIGDWSEAISKVQ